MRTRDDSGRTGRLIASVEGAPRNPGAGLLFLVSGYGDVGALERIERCADQVRNDAKLDSFHWFDVADRSALAELNPLLDASRILLLEVAEFAGMSDDDATTVLRLALGAVAAGETTFLPAAGAAVGGIAEGRQFLGREDEGDQLAAMLDVERLVLLIGPRRTGKSSLLRELVRRRPGGLRAAHVDVESAFTWDEAVGLVASQLAATSLMASCELIRIRGADAVLAKALADFRDAGPGSPALLVDELVYFLRNLTAEFPEADRPRVALNAITRLAKSCSDARICLVIGGSIGLIEYLSHELGIAEEDLPPSVQTARSYVLPPLDVSHGCLLALLMGAGIVPEIGDAEWLREQLDLAMPRVALAFLDELTAQVRSSGPVPASRLEGALDRFVAGTADFREVLDRLQLRSMDRPGFRGALMAILRRLAAEGSPRLSEETATFEFARVPGLDPGESLRWIVENLPVRRENGDLVLASRIFGRWWRQHHA